MKSLGRMTRPELIRRVRIMEQATRLAQPATNGRTSERACRDNAERLQAIVHTAAEGIITIDRAGRIESVNPAAEAIFGYRSSQMLGRNVRLLMPRSYRRNHSRSLANYLLTGSKKMLGTRRELIGRRKDGTSFPMELSVAEVHLNGGRMFIGFVRDIIKRREAEQALHRTAVQLTRAQELAHLGSYEIDVGKRRTSHWSPEIVRILGLTPRGQDVPTARYIGSIVHVDDRERVRQALRKAVRERRRYQVEYRILRPDGSIRYVQSIAEPVLGPNGKVTRLVGTLQDITERKELEKEILQISEREQQRIGQDLHDGLCQHLAGIEFRLHSLRERLAKTSKTEAAEVIGLAKLVQASIEQTRALAYGLSPIMVPAEGLMSGLTELARHTEELYGISCSLTCPVPVLVQDLAVATHLYRIAQEAVHNAVRHAKAKFIVIQLLKARRRITLGVKDDGIGLPRKRDLQTGMGLRIMQSRASMIGAKLILERDLHGGTSVICTVRKTPGLEQESVSGKRGAKP